MTIMVTPPPLPLRPGELFAFDENHKIRRARADDKVVYRVPPDALQIGGCLAWPDGFTPPPIRR